MTTEVAIAWLEHVSDPKNGWALSKELTQAMRTVVVAYRNAEVRELCARIVFRALADFKLEELTAVNEFLQADVDTVVAREQRLRAMVNYLADSLEMCHSGDFGITDCASQGRIARDVERARGLMKELER